MQLKKEGKVYQSSACFGKIMKASCSSTEHIFPINVMVGVKPTSTNCTLETAVCCSIDSEDCVGRYTSYTPGTADVFYEDCMGRSTCLERQAGWTDTLRLQCQDPTAYPAQTQYMYRDYNCIDGKYKLKKSKREYIGLIQR